eukprot:scaffold34916_cov170-Amphora_coffeaeformis.AAC.10
MLFNGNVIFLESTSRLAEFTPGQTRMSPIFLNPHLPSLGWTLCRQTINLSFPASFVPVIDEFPTRQQGVILGTTHDPSMISQPCRYQRKGTLGYNSNITGQECIPDE